MKASAWKVEKPGPDLGRWRGLVMRPSHSGGFEIAWSAPETRETRAAAIRDAQAHLRRNRNQF